MGWPVKVTLLYRNGRVRQMVVPTLRPTLTLPKQGQLRTDDAQGSRPDDTQSFVLHTQKCGPYTDFFYVESDA